MSSKVNVECSFNSRNWCCGFCKTWIHYIILMTDKLFTQKAADDWSLGTIFPVFSTCAVCLGMTTFFLGPWAEKSGKPLNRNLVDIKHDELIFMITQVPDWLLLLQVSYFQVVNFDWFIPLWVFTRCCMGSCPDGYWFGNIHSQHFAVIRWVWTPGRLFCWTHYQSPYNIVSTKQDWDGD